MSGWIFGSEKQTHWTQVMRRHKSRFQNPLRQNFHHVKVIQELLGVRSNQIKNLVAFVGSAEPRTEMPNDVFWAIKDLLEYIHSCQEIYFSQNEVYNFTKKLNETALEKGKETHREHVRNLREQITRKKTDKLICPRCGANMVERQNKNTGQTFLGCSRFPHCKTTRKLN